MRKQLSQGNTLAESTVERKVTRTFDDLNVTKPEVKELGEAVLKNSDVTATLRNVYKNIFGSETRSSQANTVPKTNRSNEGAVSLKKYVTKELTKFLTEFIKKVD